LSREGIKDKSNKSFLNIENIREEIPLSLEKTLRGGKINQFALREVKINKISLYGDLSPASWE
jgi:hypothetical protein